MPEKWWKQQQKAQKGEQSKPDQYEQPAAPTLIPVERAIVGGDGTNFPPPLKKV
jgi:hypothetical protein